MQIEDIARICLTSRRTTQNQRHLAICDRLFREVIIYHESMTSCITEILANRRTCKRSVVAECCRVSGCGCHDNGVVHGTLLLECLHQTGNCRSFLTNCHIDTVHRLTSLICGTLVEYRVNGDSCLTCLTIADDQLTLSASYRNH